MTVQSLRSLLLFPLVPLLYLLLVALPLSIWASPGVDPIATAVFVAGLALLVLAAATTAAHRAAGTLFWARVYFALGAVLAASHARFATNELAGVMLLFAPLAATLALSRPIAAVHRLQAGLLALLFGGTLAATGSRGGLVAFAAAGAAQLALARRWRLLTFGALAAGLATVIGGDWLLHDGQQQGLSLDSLFTGRPEIWQRSLQAIADFGWTGVGFGAYGRVVPALCWPADAHGLEHAHSLVLQTALDLGIPGLLAIAILVAAAFPRILAAYRCTPPDKPRSYWALGLFGSLLAFTLFGLADAVPLGTAGGLAFCLLLGLVYALPAPRVRRRRRRLLARFLLIGLLLLGLGLTSIHGAHRLNRAAVTGARAILDEPAGLGAAHAALANLRPATCRAGWLEGKVAQAWDRPDLRDAAWSDLLRCAAAFVKMIEDELPHHRALAETALEAQPESPAAHFWLARVRARAGHPHEAQDLYRHGLDLAPRDGKAWYELGRLVAPEDPRAALDAFDRACRHGDPGANACRAAGQTAEHLGDLDAAIRHYRRSRLGSARARAAELENGQTTPASNR